MVCQLTLLYSKHGERWELARRCQPIFAAPANKRRALAGVLYVACDTKIEDFALTIECAIVMPAYVSVPVKSLADHGPNKVRVPIQDDIRARRVECHGKSTRRGGIKLDSLCPLRNAVRFTRWTYIVE